MSDDPCVRVRHSLFAIVRSQCRQSEQSLMSLSSPTTMTAPGSLCLRYSTDKMMLDVCSIIHFPCSMLTIHDHRPNYTTNDILLIASIAYSSDTSLAALLYHQAADTLDSRSQYRHTSHLPHYLLPRRISGSRVLPLARLWIWGSAKNRLEDFCVSV